MFNFFNQIMHRIDYFLYFEGMYCMFCLVGRFSMTGFSNKIIIIPFTYGEVAIYEFVYMIHDVMSLIVEAQRI